MKRLWIWVLVIAVIVIGAIVGGGAYVFDPKKACRDSGGQWVKMHCEY
ncbi:hypothetical protein [Asticcacaulis sp. 201]|nr:hypothetical protein [Asticcacaulis sp. 201]MDV6330516.1 hypothetical protein [Asticcacaulis sp. 201]